MIIKMNIPIDDILNQSCNNLLPHNMVIPLSRDQTMDEKTILKDYGNSKKYIIERYRPLLHNINNEKVFSIIQDKYYDPNVLNVISNIMATIINYAKDPLAEDHIIHHWMSYAKVISTSSLEGNIIATNLYGINKFNKLFIVKSAKEGFNVIHELFVGLMGINSLRDFIPNFVYTFGGMSCSSPSINNREIITWCNPYFPENENIIYENIQGETIYQYLINSDSNIKDILIYYLQILYSLNIAVEKVGFTHHDLHSNNIILRETEILTFYIPYNINGKMIYLYTNKIATIIDFGFSRINYKEKGYNKIRSCNEISKSIFPMNDAYHLIIDILLILKYHNVPFYEKLKPIIKFFINISDSEINDFLNRDSRTILNLPLNEITSKNRLNDLINHIINQYPEIKYLISDTYSPNYPILHCSPCQSVEQIEQQIGIDTSTDITTLFDLYSLLLIGDRPSIDTQKILEMIKQPMDEFNKLIKQLNDDTTMIPYLNEIIILSQNILSNTDDTQNINKLMNTDLTKIMVLYQQLITLIDLWAMIYKAYDYIKQSNNTVPYIDELMKNLSKSFMTTYSKYVDEINNVLNKFLLIMNQIDSGNLRYTLYNYTQNTLPTYVELIQLRHEGKI